MQGSKYAADRNHYRRYPRRRGPPRNYQQNYQNSESGEKNEGAENIPEGQAQQRRPYRRRRYPPYYMRRPYGRRPQYSNPPVQGEIVEVTLLEREAMLGGGMPLLVVQGVVWMRFGSKMKRLQQVLMSGRSQCHRLKSSLDLG